MITREQIKKAVPYGYAKVIAERAGVTPKAVSDYFGGVTNSAKVEAATLEVLEEIKKSKEAVSSRFFAAMSN